MNKRIEELSLQCIRYKLIAEGARSDFDYKKFAELIVRECADLFDKDEMELTLTERTIHNTIKEHFGVKE
jgi:hypothetical protein